MNARTLFLPAIAFLFTACTISTAQAQRADHHLHIRSQAGTDALLKVLKEVKEQTGVKLQPSVDAGDVIALLDSTGTQQAALLSTAYFFGMPELDFANEQSRVRRENKYVARQASKYPDRLAAFCGVNPLSEYALEEITWCGSDGRFTGLKLHLANSKVDLRNKKHVQRLAKVFRTADRQNLAIIIHLWTRNENYGPRDIEIFMNQIFPEAPDVTVQVAHMGGPGTYSKVTGSVADRFVQLISGRISAYENLYFDLASVPLSQPKAKSEQKQNRIETMNKKLVEDLRQLGPERMIWGTDYIAGPLKIYEAKRNALSLPDSLRDTINSNTAPYIQD